MDQVQFEPGSIPEASTSDTNAATEAEGTEGAATTVGAAVAVTGEAVAGGVVMGALTTTDVEVVVDVTTGAVLGVVVVG